MVTTTIYFLIDPRTDEIRYVGKTIQDLKTRLQAHMRDTYKCHRVHWLNELKREGLLPRILVVEDIRGAWPWQESERFWIKWAKANGARLTNNTSGGDGVNDLPPETRQRMRQAMLGRKLTPEQIEKMRAKRIGSKASEETKKRMSLAQKGRKILWTDKIALSLRKITPEMAEIIKQRVANGERVKDLAVEFGVHRTTISKINTGTYFERYNKSRFSTKNTDETGVCI